MKHWLKETALPLAKRTFKAWGDDDCSRLAASLAYYAVFSIFPLILLLISALGYYLRFRGNGVNDEARLVEQLLASVGTNVSPDISNALGGILTDVKLQAGSSGPIALATTLLAASGIFVQLDKAFDTIWNIPPEQGSFFTTLKHTLIDRGKAFLLVLAIGALLISSLVASSVLSAVGKFAEKLPAGDTGWQIVTILVAFSINVLVFGLLFYAMPKPKMRWRDVLPAAIITALLWEIGKIVLSSFLGKNQYTASATVGAFIALLAWIYYGSMILFIGAEFSQVYTDWNKERRAAAGPPVTLPLPPELPSVLLPDPQATAQQKAAYAVGGTLIGMISAVGIGVAGVVLAVMRLVRRNGS